MFPNVGWTELLVLAIVALVVIGPERLPEAARWLAGAIQKAKEFVGSAQRQLKDDFGTDFDEFKEPLKQINELRGLSPRALVTKHLLDGDESLLSSPFDAAAPNGQQAGQTALGVGGSPVPPPPTKGEASGELPPRGGAQIPPSAVADSPSLSNAPIAWDNDAT